jgi:hypothetical protein
VLEPVSKPAPAGVAGDVLVGVWLGGVFAGLVCAGIAFGAAFGAETAPVPNFAPNSATGWLAQACAENNDDHFHHGLDPMPQADTPDF